jgi:hypothetical protein
VAGLIHVDDIAAKVERVGTLVDDIDIRLGRERIAHGAQCRGKIHRARIGVEACGHAFNILLLALADLVDPSGLALDLSRLHRGIEGREHRLDVADDRRRNRPVAVEFGRRDVDLNKPGALGPQRRPAV